MCELGVVRALVEVYVELVSSSGEYVLPTERASHNRTVLRELCLYLVLVLAGGSSIDTGQHCARHRPYIHVFCFFGAVLVAGS